MGECANTEINTTLGHSVPGGGKSVGREAS